MELSNNRTVIELIILCLVPNPVKMKDFAVVGMVNYGRPNAYTALPAAIATYSLPSTANATGAA